MPGDHGAVKREFWRANIPKLTLVLIAVWMLGTPQSGRPIGPSLVLTMIVMPHVLPWATPVGRRGDETERVGGWALASLFLLLVVPSLGLIALLAWDVLRGLRGSGRSGPDVVDPASSLPKEGGTPSSDAVMDGGTTASEPADVIAELERLARLRADGTLTAAEFEAMKVKTIGQGRAAR